MSNTNRIAVLVFAYLSESLSHEEYMELMDWIKESKKNERLFDHLTSSRQLFVDVQDRDQLQQRVWENVANTVSIVDMGIATEKPTVLSFIRMKKYIVVAASILIVGVTGWFLLRNDNVQRTQELSGPAQQSAGTGDISAGKDVAILTLEDGKKIVLDSAENSMLALQGGVAVVKKDGLIEYDETNKQPDKVSAIAFNSISTPKGGQYQVLLPDGSRAKLNAASSIRFPVSFSSTARTVQISGEVFFDVVQNSKAPFSVQIVSDAGAPKAKVLVLGTCFNVNAYDDEPQSSITLVDGSLQVRGNTSGQQFLQPLKPGQQAILNTNQELRVVQCNPQQVIAWTEGWFRFRKTPVPDLMRQISRWYNVEIIYKGQTPSLLLTGEAPRNISLSRLIELLQLSGIRCQLKENQLIVLDKFS